MKKFLFGILTFLGIGLSFCSSFDFDISKLSSVSVYSGDITSIPDIAHFSLTPGLYCIAYGNLGFDGTNLRLTFSPEYLTTESVTYYQYNVRNVNNNLNTFYCFDISSNTDVSLYPNSYSITGQYYIFPFNDYFLSSSSSTISVLYNNQQSTETITCDGDSIIQIDGLSTMTNTNKFTPYFNINYRDEDNQLLTESYDKSLLTLMGNFKKTYTGDNERILTSQGGTSNTTQGIVITGDFPVFDYSGTISTDGLSGNLFTNFTDNALQVLLSNIPGYIQYVFIFGIILFIIGLVKRLRGRR